MFRALIARVTAAAAVASCLLSPAAQAQERDLKFVLDFISLGRHAPWYVALGKGYFKDEGLNVTIMPSKGTADAIRTVATGGAEIGFIDIPSLVASGSAGSSVKIVAANYQKPPYCIFTLNPGANVTEPKQMAGLELGSSTASFVPKIWAAFMEMNKVDSKTLKIVNIDAASRVPMLAAGKVQSIDQFLMSEPAIRRAVTNAKPVCLFAGDYGLEIYANSLGVSEDFLAKNPDVVKKFVRAALKGWKDALAAPEEAARIEIQYVKALDPQIVVEEIQILKRIAITPDVEKNGFGYVSTDRMKHRRLHQQEHRGVRRQTHGRADLSSGISPRGSDQAVTKGALAPPACSRGSPHFASLNAGYEDAAFTKRFRKTPACGFRCSRADAHWAARSDPQTRYGRTSGRGRPSPSRRP
jgi:NitT/TauT family transport system substrate-binding protein